MASFGDFSSLLQLGVGTGIGLSLFRAPVDLRISAISQTIQSELIALSGSESAFAKTKRRDIADLNLQFADTRASLNKYILPFMIAAVTGAIANLIALVGATLKSEVELSRFDENLLLFVSVIWFLVELLALEVLARVKLRYVKRELKEIRQRRAPPISSA